MSVPELARRGYKQWGYSSAHSAAAALYRLFQRYDYEHRSRAAANKLLVSNRARRCQGETIYGRPCRRSAMIGSRYCPYHGAEEAESVAL